LFFNRWARRLAEYARRFQNRYPGEVGARAYNWLSRGLLEALLQCLDRAEDDTYAIHGAIYEFQWPQVLEALRGISRNGAYVRIVFDAIDGAKKPRKKNLESIRAARITGLTIQRTNGVLMHNKFFVLSKNGQPVAVWTGSTNLTENGIFGHSNCGHVVEDAAVAQAYLDYWHVLKATRNPMSSKTGLLVITGPTQSMESGHHSRILTTSWYGGARMVCANCRFRTARAFHDVCFRYAQTFPTVYEQDDQVLRFALMEKEGNGKALEQGRIDIARIRRLRNVVVALGNNLKLNSFDRWLQEMPSATPRSHVNFIHTKYMLVDPLGKTPLL
jgi:phosphatidylserine/phosphatidylglycerophosphate/cardiolipin synthase-like enzyme